MTYVVVSVWTAIWWWSVAFLLLVSEPQYIFSVVLLCVGFWFIFGWYFVTFARAYLQLQLGRQRLARLTREQEQLWQQLRSPSSRR